MKLEHVLQISAALVFATSLFFVPKANRLQAQFVFLFIQFPVWLLGLVTVELGLLEYPVREFSRVNNTSFIFEYFILPIYCIHFNTRFPSSSRNSIKLLYYCGASLLLTVVEVVVEKYTDILEYTGWTWYMTFISILFVLWLSRVVTKWFFRNTNLPERRERS